MAFFFSSAVAQVKQYAIDGISVQKNLSPRTGTHLYYLSNPITIEKQGILPGIDRPEVNFWNYVNGLTIRKIFDPWTGTYLHYLSNPSYDPADTVFTLRLYNYRPPFEGREDDGAVSFNLYFLKDNFASFRDETTGRFFESRLDVIFQGNGWEDERFFRILGGVMISARFARANGKTVVLKFKIGGMGYGINLDGEGEVSSVNGPEIFVEVMDSYFEDVERG